MTLGRERCSRESAVVLDCLLDSFIHHSYLRALLRRRLLDDAGLLSRGDCRGVGHFGVEPPLDGCWLPRTAVARVRASA